MVKITRSELLGSRPGEDFRIGVASKSTVRKNGTVYHVITTSWRKKWLFDSTLAAYRKDLLHELCIKRGITILFSASMPTHTHDVFITPDWETLSGVMKTLDSAVAKYVRRHFPERIKGRNLVFSKDPVYIMVEDIRHLFFLGKYIHGNCQYLKDEGKPVPDSCFWMFRKNYLAPPYNERIYSPLFGMSAPELIEFYESHSDAEVRRFANEKYKDWTKEDNDNLFVRR